MPTLTGAIAPDSALSALPYPGRILRKNVHAHDAVLALQRRLNEVGCGPIDEDGEFGEQTEDAVQLFQTRFTDLDGQPLEVDGEVGSITWSRLFGKNTVTITDAPDVAHPLLQNVLHIAETQIGVREQPLGSNRGPQVDTYLQRVGLNPVG